MAIPSFLLTKRFPLYSIPAKILARGDFSFKSVYPRITSRWTTKGPPPWTSEIRSRLSRVNFSMRWNISRDVENPSPEHGGDESLHDVLKKAAHLMKNSPRV